MGEWITVGKDGKGAKVRAGDEVAFAAERIKQIQKTIDFNLNTAVSEVSALVTSNARRSAKVATGLKLAYAISISWLKTIPVGGGYIGLINKILQNPLGGGYEVFRSQYGGGFGDGPPGGFGIFGSASNGVMSPLTYGAPDENGITGLEGYNLATAAPTLFQQNQRIKFEQAEAEMQALLSCPGIGSLWGVQGGSSVDADAQKQILAGLSHEAAERVNKAYETNPQWFFYHALASLQTGNVNSRNGARDLKSGVFDNADGTAWVNQKTMDGIIKSSFAHMSKNSEMYSVLSNFQRNTVKREKILSLLQSKVEVDGDSTDNTSQFVIKGLTEAQMRAVEIAKAKYVAYRPVMTEDALFANIASNGIKTKIKSLNGDSELSKTLDTPNFTPTFAAAWSLIHAIITAYFGSMRISGLPLGADTLKEIIYALVDASESAAAFISDETLLAKLHLTKAQMKERWFNWFLSQMMTCPDVVAYLTMYKRSYDAQGEHKQLLSIDEVKGIMKDCPILGLSEFNSHTGTHFRKPRLRRLGATAVVGNTTGFMPRFQGENPASDLLDGFRSRGEASTSWKDGVLDGAKSKLELDAVQSLGVDESVRDAWVAFSDWVKTFNSGEADRVTGQEAMVGLHRVLRTLLTSVGLRAASRAADPGAGAPTPVFYKRTRPEQQIPNALQVENTQPKPWTPENPRAYTPAKQPAEGYRDQGASRTAVRVPKGGGVPAVEYDGNGRRIKQSKSRSNGRGLFGNAYPR